MTIEIGFVSDFMKNHHHQGENMATLAIINLDDVRAPTIPEQG